MASQLGQGQQLESQGQAQQQQGAKGDIAPVLQQLNLTSLRTRTQDLHTAIGRILQAFHSNPPTKWSDVLAQFAMVNVELLNLVDDIKPILRMYVVYPKNVNAENAPILPIMLSSKLLPEMEVEEAAMKEQMIGSMANLPVPLQTDKLQRQIEAVRSACDIAEKVMTEARKVYQLGSRQGPVALATLDKVHVSRIAEQERLLRAATNGGEGLRLPPEQNQQPAILPQHLSAAFATTRDGRASSYPGGDGGKIGGYAKASVPVLPPTGLRSSVQQQPAQLGSRVQTPSQSIGAGGGGGLAVSSPPQMPYMVNSPRSGSNSFNVSSPQQSQTQQQSQLAMLQRTQAQQKQLQRQQQMQAQLQQHHHQQQQLRHPTTPPIQQAQPGSQLQAQVGQPLLQQQKQQLQQQSQNRLTQQMAHHQQAQLQQQALQIHQERQHALQVSQQQQNLQQQLQSSQLQAAQNAVQQANQVRPQIGQQGSSMSNLYSSGTHPLMSSNVIGAMNQTTQSTSLLQQRIQQLQQGNISTNQLTANQPQQNVPSMLSDSWGTGTGTQLPQNSGNLGLPLQQQQLPQTNYMNMFNNPAQTNFGQTRQQPPPS